VVTHDQEEALSMASRVGVMNRGRLVQIGTPTEIYERPGSRFVADFVGEVNLFEGELTGQSDGQALALAGCATPIPLPLPVGLPDSVKAALAVRPEKVVLSHSPPAGFAIAGTVVSIGYLGGGSIVHLATADGKALKAYLPGATAANFGRGARVWASWPREAGVVLRQ
jgi:putrescine transport system ATP-binding protein